MNEEILQLKLKEAGINEDDMCEVCNSLTPLINVIRKYDKKYLKHILDVVLELINEV